MHLTNRFKGSAESTFEQYPDRLAHLLMQTHPDLRIEAHVYPTYETRGSLEKTVECFVTWLTERVVELENGIGAGTSSVVLCGHSMGGIVAADAALAIARTSADRSAAWPRIRGVVAYDTPYLGCACSVARDV